MRFSPGRDDSSMPVTAVTGDVSSVDSKVPEGRQQISPHALSSLPGLSSFWWLYPSAIADGNEPPSLPGLNRFLCFHSASLFSTQNPSRRCLKGRNQRDINSAPLGLCGLVVARTQGVALGFHTVSFQPGLVPGNPAPGEIKTQIHKTCHSPKVT